MDYYVNKSVTMSTSINYIYPYDYEAVIALLKERFPFITQVAYKELNIGEIYPSCLHVYEERLLNAKRAVSLCNKYKIGLGEPYIELYDNGAKHLVAPPIIEMRTGKYLLCDGMHRLFVMRENKIRKTEGIIIYDSPLPLAGKINTWDNVTIEDRQLPVKENFIDYNPNGLTGYSKFCNSSVFWRN